MSRLPVVLLWHMHQPQYRDGPSGRYVLPWTYLHAIKDYTDMAAHLEAQPTARAVINLTPILLEQLDELSARIAQHLAAGTPLPDPVMALLGPDPVPQAPAERLELLKACLRAERTHLIERFGPYLEIAGLAETLASLERVNYASDQMIHDLAVWYHIAWMGETVRRSDARIATLTEQGRGYSVAQRRELLGIVGELIGSVIPRFRRLAERGQCELSVSPYAHPILPLLIDFKSAREAAPASPLPHASGYAGGAERAAWHIAESIRVFMSYFGARPRGCWPSEGAVSTASLELLSRHGFTWAASSANVLRASLNASGLNSEDPQAFNRPYHLPRSPLQCFFRDDVLSDLVGFTYATWHGDDAAQNLVHECVRLAQSYEDDSGHAVLIALDGENAWEHYPFNGYYFLSALYRELANHPQIELMTLSDCVARGLAARELPTVVAGSWVHGTLGTWMGDVAKNAAWDLLAQAKLAVDRRLAASDPPPASREAIVRQLALCESSDWFWWFGDYNPAEAVSQFDQLYRRQLLRLYQLLGEAPPEALAHPLSVGHGVMEHGGVMRRASGN